MSELVRVVIQCGHLVGDTIVQGSATSHMVPVEQADGKLREMTQTCSDMWFIPLHVYIKCLSNLLGCTLMVAWCESNGEPCVRLYV